MIHNTPVTGLYTEQNLPKDRDQNEGEMQRMEKTFSHFSNTHGKRREISELQSLSLLSPQNFTAMWRRTESELRVCCSSAAFK